MRGLQPLTTGTALTKASAGRAMKRAVSAVVVALILSVASPVSAETLTNDSVVAMITAGLTPETVIAKIKASENAFNVSSDQLIYLRTQNVPDVVIATMLDRADSNAASRYARTDLTAPHASGIYLLESSDGPEGLRHIDAITSNQIRTTGILSYMTTFGIAKVKTIAVVPNSSARVRSSISRPSFYFYFDQSSSGLSGDRVGGVWFPGAVTSPSEFSLVRLDVASDTREVVMEQFGMTTGLQMGVPDKARVGFTYENVSQGVFKVTPQADLSPGEYAFIYSVSNGRGEDRARSARIFDFTILPPSADSSSR